MEKNEKKEQAERTTLPKDSNPIPAASYSPDEEWVQQHEKDFSEEPSFF